MADFSAPCLYLSADGTIRGAYDPFCRAEFDEGLFGLTHEEALTRLAAFGWRPAGEEFGRVELTKNEEEQQ